jgi:hypothetical protein
VTVSHTEPTATKRCDEINLLLSPFRERVTALLGRMTALGFSPVLWETYRSPERAAMLVVQGKSHARGGKSMHCYGIAADFICGEHKWSCDERDEHGKRKYTCDFFHALGDQARHCGLTWGGDWDSNPLTPQGFDDRPHVQAVALEQQDAIRAAGDHVAREAIVRAHMGPVGA